jgi:hypothetical protein
VPIAPALKESDEPAANARLDRVEGERLGARTAAPPTRVVFPEVAAQWVRLVLGQTMNVLVLDETESAHPEWVKNQAP